MNVLTEWKIKSRDRYVYCTGLFHGKRWITSDVVQLVQEHDRYVVFTENSVYHLYW